MNSKILIIAIAIAVIATVFMGCAKNNNDMTTTTFRQAKPPFPIQVKQQIIWKAKPAVL